MSHRGTMLAAAAAMVLAGAAVHGAGQEAKPAPAKPAQKAVPAKKWVQPRTPWGHPDLQGIWNNGTTTPLERPADLADREFLSEEEWAARAKEIATRALAENRPKDPLADVELAYNNEWWDRGAPLMRTSLIVDPPNGKLPALTPEGQQIVAARAAARKMRGPADSWVDRPLQERCLLYHGTPPFPTGYNNNYQIVQTPTSVAIRYEMLAEVRIIPLDNRPHLRGDLRQWMGSPLGHWEGDTLVVETTNYSPKTTFRFPASDNLKVVEYFKRTDADNIDYRFTVHDSTMYTRPWTAVLPLVKAPGPLFEYACHEGNYGIQGVLSGHRAQERKAAEAQKGSSK